MMTIGGRAHTIEEVIQVCDLGYPFVEINFNHPDEIETNMGILQDIKRKYGIYYLAHFPNEGNPADLKTLHDRFLPNVKKLLTLCPLLKIEKGTIHFWMDARMEWASEAVISEKLGLLSQLVDHAANCGVTLCLENLSCKYDSFTRFFSEIPALMMTMDIGHGQLLTRENTAFGFMAHLFDKIAHVHVHDNLGGDKATDDLHLPLGRGIVDFPKIFTILRNKKYESTMTMEVAPDKMAATHGLIMRYF